jgi:dTMP kinase
MDSTRVYQGALGNVDMRLIKGLERVTVGNVVPDLTFILDVPAAVGIRRAAQRRGKAEADRFESEDIGFHEALRTAYAQLAELEPNRCVLIDATQPKEAVQSLIWAAVMIRLQPPQPERRRQQAAP